MLLNSGNKQKQPQTLHQQQQQRQMQPSQFGTKALTPPKQGSMPTMNKMLSSITKPVQMSANTLGSKEGMPMKHVHLSDGNNVRKISGLPTQQPNKPTPHKKIPTPPPPSQKPPSPSILLPLYNILTSNPQKVTPQDLQPSLQAFSLLLKPSPQNLPESERYNFEQYSRLGQPYRTVIKKYLGTMLQLYIKARRPYLTQSAVIQFFKKFMQENKELLILQNGETNVALFYEIGVFNDSDQTTWVYRDDFFGRKVWDSIQLNLGIFVNQFCTLFTKVLELPHSEKLLTPTTSTTPNLVYLLFQFLIHIFNKDNQNIQFRNIDEKLFEDIISLMIHAHEKVPSLFDKKIVQRVFIYFDKHMCYICESYDITKTRKQESKDRKKQREDNLGQKCIRFCNLLLFKFPYGNQQLDNSIKKCLSQLKSPYFQPFKWTFLSMSNPDSFRQLSNFPQIFGKQWTLLLCKLLKLSQSLQYQNEELSQKIYYLLCSIIEQDPHKFWSCPAEYQPIYEYICKLYENYENQERDIDIGKFTRIMLAACPKKEGVKGEDKWVQAGLLRESVVRRVGKGEGVEDGGSIDGGFGGLVYSSFVSGILAIQGLTTQKLFGDRLLNYLQYQYHQFPKQQFHSSLQPSLQRYQYYYPVLTIYELFLHLISESPKQTKQIYKIWKKCYPMTILEHRGKSIKNSRTSLEMDSIIDNLGPGHSEIKKEVLGIQQFLKFFIIDMCVYVGATPDNTNFSTYYDSEDMDEQQPLFNPVPICLQLIDKFLTSQLKSQMLSILLDQEVLSCPKLQQMLQSSVHNPASVTQLLAHIETIHSLNLQNTNWNVRILSPILQTLPPVFKNLQILHTIKLCTIHLKKVYKNSSPTVFQISPLQLLTNLSEKKSLEKVGLLILREGDILDFVGKMLRIQEHYQNKESFYNWAYNQWDIGRNQNALVALETVLEFLQALILVYVNMGDRVYFGDKFRKFLGSIANAGNKGRTNIGSQIQICNKKVATLPAALSYLICTPTPTPNQPTPPNFQIKSLALNILTLLVTNSSSSWCETSYFSTGRLPETDAISSVDFNVYQEFFISQNRKIYAESKTLLLSYLLAELKNGVVSTLFGLGLEGLYRGSYHYGQCVDMIQYISQLFNSETVIESISKRITQEYQNPNSIDEKVCQLVSKWEPHQNSDKTGDIAGFICDRQLMAYSRFLFQFSLCYQTKVAHNAVLLYKKLLHVVLNKLLNLVLQLKLDPQLQPQITQISSNIWRSIRVLQTKYTGTSTSQLYLQCLRKLMPFIFNSYHLQLEDQQYQKEYQISIKLVLASGDYMNANDFNSICAIDKIRDMVYRWIRDCATFTHRVDLLFCGVVFWRRLYPSHNDPQYRNNLQQIYNILNNTQNPLKTNIPLNPTPSLTALILMLHQQLQLLESSESLYKCLLQISPSSLPAKIFNSCSLLYNIQTNLNKENLTNAIYIANNSCHELEFISVCHYLYQVFGSDKLPIIQDNQSTDSLIAFIQQSLSASLSVSSKKSASPTPSTLPQSWSLTLLHLLLSKCQKSLLIRLANWLIKNTELMSLFGELISLFGEVSVKWPYFNPNSFKYIKFIRLGLREKILLLAILKVFGVLVARRDEWLGKSRNQGYNQLCKCFIYGSKVINRHMHSQSLQSLQSPSSPYKPQTQNPTSTPYQQTLQSQSIQWLYQTSILQSLQKLPPVRGPYPSFPSSVPSSVPSSFPSLISSSAPNTKIETSKIYLLHAGCQNYLDLVHDHYNLLVVQQYLGVLLGVYGDLGVMVDRYQFGELFQMFQSITRRLSTITSSKQVYLQANRQLTTVFSSARMCTNLHYLNLLQQTPSDTLQILNTIAECCIHCIINIKQVLEMHKDYKEFIGKAEKIFRNAKKFDKMFSFDFMQMVENGGFQPNTKSAYGGSFMGGSVRIG